LKNKNDELKNEFFLQKLEFFFKRYIIILVLVGIIGISLRFYFLDFDIPVHSDSFEYFRIANDIALKQEINFAVTTKGWPTFLSIFFSVYQSNNFMDYHALQRILSISISVITIIPTYFFCKVFFDKKISIVASSFFILEPHIIQNSTLGLSEPLFVFLGTISLALFFQNKSKWTTLSFVILALFVFVRSEGIILFGILAIVFFLRKKIKKSEILWYLVAISLFAITLFGLMSIFPSPEKDVLYQHIDSAIYNVYDTRPSNNFNEKILSGTEVLIKKIGQTIVPYFLVFVPVGIFMLLKQRNYHNTSLLVVLILGLIASTYIFSRINDIRYIFWLYPILCVISGFALEKFFNHFNQKNILFVGIVCAMIVMSVFLISIEDVSDRNREAFQFAYHVNENTNVINFYFQSGYLQYVNLSKLNKFPIQSSEFPDGIKIIDPAKCCLTLDEFINHGEQNGLTHIVIDNTSKKTSIFDGIFYHEDKYAYLKKVYDTKENGYKYYHAKIFVIDFEDFERNVEGLDTKSSYPYS